MFTQWPVATFSQVILQRNPVPAHTGRSSNFTENFSKIFFWIFLTTWNSPERVSINKTQAAKYSFGIRHSDFVAPFVERVREK